MAVVGLLVDRRKAEADGQILIAQLHHAAQCCGELRIHDQRLWTRRRRGHRDGLPRQNAARRCAATRAGFARAAVIAIIFFTLVARSASLFLASLLLALSRWRRKLCEHRCIQRPLERLEDLDACRRHASQ